MIQFSDQWKIHTNGFFFVVPLSLCLQCFDAAGQQRRYPVCKTSISANADGPRDAASCKIHHIALPTSIITRQRALVDSKLLRRQRNIGYYHIFER